MTTALAPFDFSGQQLRVVTDEHGDPWFVAADVARILGYRDAFNMVRRLDEDDRGTRQASTPSGDQVVTVISEAGLYAAVLGSQVEGARTFKRWVTHEVLPQIRRTGSYVAPRSDRDRALALAHEVIALSQRNAELEPRAAVADQLMAAHGDYSLREAAQILCRDHGIDTGQNRLLRHLRDLGWVDTRGMPYQRHIEAGRVAVRTRTYEHPHTGEPQITTQLRVTAKGLTWLHQNWPRRSLIAV
jgi:prophage antirepressor-like protein